MKTSRRRLPQPIAVFALGVCMIVMQAGDLYALCDAGGSCPTFTEAALGCQPWEFAECGYCDGIGNWSEIPHCQNTCQSPFCCNAGTACNYPSQTCNMGTPYLGTPGTGTCTGDICPPCQVMAYNQQVACFDSPCQLASSAAAGGTQFFFNGTWYNRPCQGSTAFCAPVGNGLTNNTCNGTFSNTGTCVQCLVNADCTQAPTCGTTCASYTCVDNPVYSGACGCGGTKDPCTGACIGGTAAGSVAECGACTSACECASGNCSGGYCVPAGQTMGATCPSGTYHCGQTYSCTSGSFACAPDPFTATACGCGGTHDLCSTSCLGGSGGGVALCGACAAACECASGLCDAINHVCITAVTGNTCQSGPNNCGQHNTGVLGCDGTSCSAGAPANITTTCLSAANNCGQQNSGILCPGPTGCTASTPQPVTATCTVCVNGCSALCNTGLDCTSAGGSCTITAPNNPSGQPCGYCGLTTDCTGNCPADPRLTTCGAPCNLHKLCNGSCPTNPSGFPCLSVNNCGTMSTSFTDCSGTCPPPGGTMICGRIDLEETAAAQDGVVVELRDSNGKVVDSQKTIATNGLTNFGFNVANPGTYVVTPVLGRLQRSNELQRTVTVSAAGVVTPARANFAIGGVRATLNITATQIGTFILVTPGAAAGAGPPPPVDPSGANQTYSMTAGPTTNGIGATIMVPTGDSTLNPTDYWVACWTPTGTGTAITYVRGTDLQVAGGTGPGGALLPKDNVTVACQP